jgi:hypothetical protein
MAAEDAPSRRERASGIRLAGDAAAIMTSEREQILRQIEQHRSVLVALEARLHVPQGAREPSPGWPPKGFYLTYYVVAGLLIGVLGSLASFLCNVLGSLLLEQDPLLFLRVYGTVFLGEKALVTDDLSFFMLVAVVHFSVGAIAGAVFHVLVNFFVPDRAGLQIGLGVLYGLLMWVINFYVAIAWLQRDVFGEAYVLQLMPAWVAALTHVVYGLTLGLLQPLGRFVPYRTVQGAA